MFVTFRTAFSPQFYVNPYLNLKFESEVVLHKAFDSIKSNGRPQFNHTETDSFSGEESYVVKSDVPIGKTKFNVVIIENDGRTQALFYMLLHHIVDRYKNLEFNVQAIGSYRESQKFNFRNNENNILFLDLDLDGENGLNDEARGGVKYFRKIQSQRYFDNLVMAFTTREERDRLIQIFKQDNYQKFLTAFQKKEKISEINRKIAKGQIDKLIENLGPLTLSFEQLLKKFTAFPPFLIRT